MRWWWAEVAVTGCMAVARLLFGAHRLELAAATLVGAVVIVGPGQPAEQRADRAKDRIQ